MTVLDALARFRVQKASVSGDEEAEAEKARWQTLFSHADPSSSHGPLHAAFDFLDHLSEKIRNEIEATFAHLGLLLADHACKFCLAGIIFALLCMTGLPLVEFERDINELTQEQNSKTALDYFQGQEIFKSSISEAERDLAVLYSVPDGKNLLDSPYFEQALAIHHEILMNVTSKEAKEVYQKDCNRFFDNPNESCIVFCPLDPPYLVGLHKGGRGFRNSSYSMMGGRARVEQDLDPEDDHGHFEFSDSFICRYESLSNDWKFGAVLWAHENRVHGDVRISANSAAFQYEEALRGTYMEAPLFLTSGVIVWLFCGVVMHFINFENHSWFNATNWFTATICIGSAILAMLAAVGLGGFLTILGLKLTASSLYVSFMILGIAVDDMMILAGLFFEAPKDHSLAERLAASFGSAAASITLTSVTTLAGFLAGSAGGHAVDQHLHSSGCTGCIRGLCNSTHVLCRSICRLPTRLWQVGYLHKGPRTCPFYFGEVCSVVSPQCGMQGHYLLFVHRCPLYIALWNPESGGILPYQSADA